MAIPRNPIDPRSGRRRPGRPPSLTAPVIADAVIRVGFDDLTVAAVAEELKVNTATLYRYVSGRSELIAMGVDRILSRLEWPAPAEDWRAYLEANAWTLWRTLSAHRGLATVFLTAYHASEHVVRHVDEVVRVLIGLGFTPEDAVLAMDMVFDLASDAVQAGEKVAAPAPEGSVRESMAADWDSLLSAEVRPAVASMFTASPETWFDRKLGIVLTGIAATLGPDRAP